MKKQMQSQMEEIAVELSDSEERLHASSAAACGALEARFEQAPWVADGERLREQLEARVAQAEQGQLDLSELAHTLSSRLESGLAEADREVKSVADALDRAVAEAADVRRSTLQETTKLGEGIAQLDSKLDEAARQLAERIDDRATTLGAPLQPRALPPHTRPLLRGVCWLLTDNETAALAGQVDATLEKVYGRMDGFAAEVKQFVAKQQDKWKAASDTHKDLHSGLASLRGDTVRHTTSSCLLARQQGCWLSGLAVRAGGAGPAGGAGWRCRTAGPREAD